MGSTPDNVVSSPNQQPRVMKPGSRHRSGHLLDGEGRLVDSISCRHCKYDLCGVDAEGRCPECGNPVEATLIGNLLQFANIAWLKRVRLGFTLLFVALAALVAQWILPIGLHSWIPSQTFGIDRLPNIEAILERQKYIDRIYWCFGGIVLSIFVMAYGALTTPEVIRGQNKSSIACRLTRWMAIAPLICIHLLNMLDPFFDRHPNQWAVIMLVVLRVVGYAALLIYFGDLANRMKAVRLEKIARYLLWAGPTWLFILILFFLFDYVSVTAGSIYAILAGILGIIVLVAAFVCCVAFLILIWQLRSKLSATIETAEMFG